MAENDGKILMPTTLLDLTSELAKRLKDQPYEVQYALIMQLVDIMDEEDQYLLGAGILMDVCDLEEDDGCTGDDFKARARENEEMMMYG